MIADSECLTLKLRITKRHLFPLVPFLKLIQPFFCSLISFSYTEENNAELQANYNATLFPPKKKTLNTSPVTNHPMPTAAVQNTNFFVMINSNSANLSSCSTHLRGLVLCQKLTSKLELINCLRRLNDDTDTHWYTALLRYGWPEKRKCCEIVTHKLVTGVELK